MSRRRHPAHGPRDRRPRAAEERLQKVLAAAGVGSRRECEALILAGRVEVDRQVVDELGRCIDPIRQEVRVDGEPLRRAKRVYYVVNKPAGVVCTNRDPDGRVRLIDLVRSDERLFPVGRLDRTSEGLMLATNDGELAHLLTHPRYGVHKVYRVRVAGRPAPDLLRKLTDGIHLAEGFVRAVAVRVRHRYRDATELEIVLNEGRNREIRRLLARIGHKVLRLKRVAIGPIQLGDLPTGAHRRLSVAEVRALQAACYRANQAGQGKGRRRQHPARRAISEQPPAEAERQPRSFAAGARGGSVLGYDEPSREARTRGGDRRVGRKRRAGGQRRERG
jgi:23S rRNA pseudouridine2605 synthase